MPSKRLPPPNAAQPADEAEPMKGTTTSRASCWLERTRSKSRKSKRRIPSKTWVLLRSSQRTKVEAASRRPPATECSRPQVNASILRRSSIPGIWMIAIWLGKEVMWICIIRKVPVSSEVAWAQNDPILLIIQMIRRSHNLRGMLKKSLGIYIMISSQEIRKNKRWLVTPLSNKRKSLTPLPPKSTSENKIRF